MVILRSELKRSSQVAAALRKASWRRMSCSTSSTLAPSSLLLMKGSWAVSHASATTASWANWCTSSTEEEEEDEEEEESEREGGERRVRGRRGEAGEGRGWEGGRGGRGERGEGVRRKGGGSMMQAIKG